ncbi:hypothetical protein [Enterococcus lactis]|uniref:hypothetical protein n=1 Tax=Enterococcus lactis TaxID=357441 RepID=UPI0039A56E6E
MAEDKFKQAVTKNMDTIQKYLNIIGNIFLLIVVSVLLIFSAYSSWKDQQAFSMGEKSFAMAQIKVDSNHVKTYNFSENSYGVDASASKFRNGDVVKIYFLKSKPYMVAENPYVYQSVSDIFLPIIWAVII